MIVAVLGVGSACGATALADLESAAAAAGARIRLVERAVDLADAAMVCLVGDVGALAEAVRGVARDGVPVLGICGGTHALVALGLLDVALAAAPSPGICTVEGKTTPFTTAIPAGRSLQLGDAHLGFAVDLDSMVESEGRVLLRGCDQHGDSNGVAIAVCGPIGHVVGVAAHLCSDVTGPCGADGRSLILAALAWQRGTPARIDHAR